jgi:hypothetical protein
MSKAIKNRVGIDKEKARRVAGFIMDLFGYDDRIIDNILEPEERQLFYILEAEGLLSTGREETTLHDGRGWLTHYWKLKKNTIIRYSKKCLRGTKKELNIKNQKKNLTPSYIYSNLSEEVWNGRKINRKKSSFYFFKINN